jgi:hypothetical protein
MALYPSVQTAAKQELDRVIGDRLPTISDREHTPYLNALIKEVLRWYPSLPLSEFCGNEFGYQSDYSNAGIAHRSEKEIVYKGNHIRPIFGSKICWMYYRISDPQGCNCRPERVVSL